MSEIEESKAAYMTAISKIENEKVKKILRGFHDNLSSKTMISLVGDKDFYVVRFISDTHILDYSVDKESGEYEITMTAEIETPDPEEIERMKPSM